MNEKKPKELFQYQISQLNNSSKPVILDKSLSEGFKAPVQGVTEHIKDVAQPLTSGADFTEKIAAKRAALQAAKAGGKKLLGAIPLIGGLATAAMTGDASAAVPVLGDVDSLGPAPGIDSRIENGTLTDEDKIMLRQQALQRIE